MQGARVDLAAGRGAGAGRLLLAQVFNQVGEGGLVLIAGLGLAGEVKDAVLLLEQAGAAVAAGVHYAVAVHQEQGPAVAAALGFLGGGDVVADGFAVQAGGAAHHHQAVVVPHPALNFLLAGGGAAIHQGVAAEALGEHPAADARGAQVLLQLAGEVNIGVGAGDMHFQGGHRGVGHAFLQAGHGGRHARAEDEGRRQTPPRAQQGVQADGAGRIVADAVQPLRLVQGAVLEHGVADDAAAEIGRRRADIVEDGLVEIGGIEGGAGQVGAGQVGAVEAGAGQVGVGQVGAVQVGAVQVGVGKVGAGQVGFGQGGAVHIDAGEVGVPQVGAAQVGAGGQGAAEVGFAQVGAVEVGIVEVAAGQVGAAHHRAHKVAAAHIGAAQVDHRDAGVAHIAGVEVQLPVGIGFPPGSHRIAPPLDNLHQFNVGHQ